MLRRLPRIAFFLAAAISFVMAVLPHPPRLPGDPPDTILHILAFAVLGGLGALAFPARSILRLVLSLAAFGATIELVQAIPALHRDTEVLDILADILAALAAVCVARKLMNRRRG